MPSFNLPTEETNKRMADALEKIAETRVREDYTSAPGDKYLRNGDRQAGFFGFVQSSDLISGSDLASELGLTQGRLQNDDVAWIKYIWKGKICFIPIKTIRSSVSWDAIYQAGAVYGTGSTISDGEQFMLDNDDNYNPDTDRVSQDATVTINGLEYRVRLIRGAGDDPTNSYDDDDRGSIGEENEWNKIILPLHERAKTQDWNYPQYVDMPTEYWNVDLTDSDLRTHHNFGNGTYTWCQETRDSVVTDEDGTVRRVTRGHRGPSHLFATLSWTAHSNRGWRPVLELL